MRLPSLTLTSSVDYVGDASNGLTTSALYVDPGSSLSSSGDVESAAAEDHVGVVVLPDLATQTFSASSLASQVLARSSGYDAVIVVIDGSSDSYGVAAHDSAEATALATDLNGHGHDDGGSAVLATLEARDWHTGSVASSSGDSGAGAGAGAGTVVGVAGGTLGLLAAAAFAALVVRRMRAGGAQTPARDVPEELRNVVLRLDALQRDHGSELSPAVSARLQSIRANIGQLFRRIRRTGTEQQVRIASIEYVDVLTKLERALGDDYYLDILRNPRLWEDADRRRAEVEEAVRATDDQLVANIRQVNASQDLEFKVALESLVGSMDATVKDIYTHQTDPTPIEPPKDQPS